jgi:hypothetical protein
MAKERNGNWLDSFLSPIMCLVNLVGAAVATASGKRNDSPGKAAARKLLRNYDIFHSSADNACDAEKTHRTNNYWPIAIIRDRFSNMIATPPAITPAKGENQSQIDLQ